MKAPISYDAQFWAQIALVVVMLFVCAVLWLVATWKERNDR